MPLPSPVRPWHGEQNTLKRSWPRAITSAVTGIGNVVGELAVDLARVEMLVLAQLAARRRCWPPACATQLPSAKNVARLERLVARRVVHVLAAARQRDAHGDNGERARTHESTPKAYGATSDTPTGCSALEKLPRRVRDRTADRVVSMHEEEAIASMRARTRRR